MINFKGIGMETNEYVILVDEHDHPIGSEEKLKAHQDGKLHRAFSVFIFRQKAEHQWEILLQQRQFDKYHSGGLWTNTCCSHPRNNEETLTAGQRRLFEEMGIYCTLEKAGSFCYYAELDNELAEHEYDHVLVGFYNDDHIPINPREVANYRWLDLDKLELELNNQPQNFTQWFQQGYNIAKAYILKNFNK